MAKLVKDIYCELRPWKESDGEDWAHKRPGDDFYLMFFICASQLRTIVDVPKDASELWIEVFDKPGPDRLECVFEDEEELFVEGELFDIYYELSDYICAVLGAPGTIKPFYVKFWYN